MNGSPISQQQTFIAFASIGLEITVARFTVINAKTRFALDCQHREPVMVLRFAERAVHSLVPPARTAATTSE